LTPATIAQDGRRLTLACRHGATWLRSPGPLEGYPLTTAVDTLKAAHVHRFPGCLCARGIYWPTPPPARAGVAGYLDVGAEPIPSREPEGAPP
jgi:hypothetical protein